MSNTDQQNHEVVIVTEDLPPGSHKSKNQDSGQGASQHHHVQIVPDKKGKKKVSTGKLTSLFQGPVNGRG